MNLKKLMALLLAVAMMLSIVACAKTETPTDPAGTNGGNDGTTPGGDTIPGDDGPGYTVETVEGQFTYTDYVSSLAANWNPHTYETSDDSYPLDFVMSGLYSFYFNDELHPVDGKEEYAGYVIVPEMAASEPVDVTEQIKNTALGSVIPESATSGYAYTIALNPDACWDDGTPITAEDYVESMKRLLDPEMLNYRAGGYYEGSFCIAGAEAYANQGQSSYIDNGVSEAISAVSDLVKGEDGNYYYDGMPVYVAVDYPLDWCGDNSLKDYVDYYGSYLFGMDRWDELVALMNENGLVPANDETLAMLSATTTTNPNWGETDDDLPAYLVYYKEYASGLDYDTTVGLYASGEYELTLVLAKYMVGFNLLYNLSGNWLVKIDLYDECLDKENKTSTYCTSVATTPSYGPYVMTSYQSGKGMWFSKNENWWGYTDGNHIYKDPEDGKYYTMYQTTDIYCQVITEVATAKMMFFKGELMTYPLQAEDYADYGNSLFRYFSPGTVIYFIILNGNESAIQERENADDFDQSQYDLETLTLTSFHRALGLCFDKSEYCDTFSPAQSGAFGLIGSGYIYDPDTGAQYRDTDIAKRTLLKVYGVNEEDYASLDEAVNSITGYDLEGAKQWFQQAYEEALAAGYITDADGDGICDQTIQLEYSASAEASTKMLLMLEWFTEKANEAAAGTGFEGKIEFVCGAPVGDYWSSYIKSGLRDWVLGGWQGSTMDPFGLMEVYVNPNYQYDAEWFDSTDHDMTIEIDGEEITMNLYQWCYCMNGTVVTIGGKDYNFGDGMTSAENRLKILAALEEQILLTYNYLPFTQNGSNFLLTQQAYYVVEEYNPVMGRGGIAYLKYNYTDAEWDAYVESCGGTLNY